MAELAQEPGSPPVVAMVSTGIRPEEKMLVQAFEDRGIELHVADDRAIHGDLREWPKGLPDAAENQKEGHKSC